MTQEVVAPEVLSTGYQSPVSAIEGSFIHAHQTPVMSTQVQEGYQGSQEFVKQQHEQSQLQSIYNNNGGYQQQQQLLQQSPVSGYQMAMPNQEQQYVMEPVATHQMSQQVTYEQQVQHHHQQEQQIPMMTSPLAFAASPTMDHQSMNNILTMNSPPEFVNPIQEPQQQQQAPPQPPPASESVPMSQVVTSSGNNQYPTFTRMPPANIVQSFAPIYVQPATIQGGGEIYTDYVRDPYNLTLPSQLAVSGENSSQSQQAEMQNSNPGMVQANPFASNVFQSSNYFGSDTGVIPPGSEMLFGGTRP